MGALKYNMQSPEACTWLMRPELDPDMRKADF